MLCALSAKNKPFLTNFGSDHIRTSQFQICATSWDEIYKGEVKSPCLMRLQAILVFMGMKSDSMQS